MTSLLRTTSTKLLPNTMRTYATTTISTSPQIKPEGDISSVFVSLSGGGNEPLPPRFGTLKQSLISSHGSALQASWERLLVALRDEVATVKKLGSNVIPQVEFRDLVSCGSKNREFVDELRKRGVAVVRGVVPEEEALEYKRDALEYVKNNPGTKGL